MLIDAVLALAPPLFVCNTELLHGASPSAAGDDATFSFSPRFSLLLQESTWEREAEDAFCDYSHGMIRYFRRVDAVSRLSPLRFESPVPPPPSARTILFRELMCLMRLPSISVWLSGESVSFSRLLHPWRRRFGHRGLGRPVAPPKSVSRTSTRLLRTSKESCF